MSNETPAEAPAAPSGDFDSLEWLLGHPSLTSRQKQYLASLLAMHGVVTWAAAASGISPRTHYRWIMRSDAYREAADTVIKQSGEPMRRTPKNRLSRRGQRSRRRDSSSE